MPEIFIIVMLFVLDIAAPLPVHAAVTSHRPAVTDLSIEQLMGIEVESVFGASKFEQKITEAPSSISIITSSDIRQYGYRTLGETLRSIRGFYISVDRNYHYLGSRGFARPGDYNSRYLLLIDGHRLNDNIYDTASIGNELALDVDLIDRIEVIRGPGSSLYGSNAFFGVINIITRESKSINGVELSGEAASFDTYKERVTYGKQFSEDIQFLVSATHLDSKGQSLYFKEFDDPATNNGNADGGDYEKYGSTFMNLKYKDFTIESAYISRTKGIGIGSFGTVFNNKRTKTTDERGYIDMRYEKEITASTKITSKVFYDYYHYSGNYMYDYPPLTLQRDYATGKWWGMGTELSTKIGSKHTLVAGLEYQDNLLQKQRTYDENPYTSYLNDTRGSYSWAAYMQDQYSILDNVVLNAGVRYDHYKTFGDTVNPRIGIIYNPWKKTTLKFLYGEAFRAPNAYELYYSDNGNTQKASLQLEPEKIHTYELILEQYVKNYRFSLSGFYYGMKNMISQQIDPSDGLIAYQNIDEVVSKGVEFELQGKWARDVEGRFSYTYQETTNNETGRPLTNSPRHLLKLNIHVPIIKKYLSTGIEAQYTGPRRTLAGNDTGGFVVANLTLLSQELIKGLEISGSIYNLFDKKYGDPASNEFRQNVIPQDGRTFRIKLTYLF
jgi:outer membrane receptor for ferrienterochelin and colicins